MVKVVWTPAALQDVQRLHNFLFDKNPDAARRAIRAILKCALILSNQPAIGRPAPEMDPRFREWIAGFGESGYVLLYRLEKEALFILAVRHQREITKPFSDEA